MVLAAVVAIVIVGTSFPLTTLVSQHRQLAAARTDLAVIQHQNRLLTEQQSRLHSPTVIRQLARADYQLVQPGQTLFAVLPGAGVPSIPGTPVGDPGAQRPVAPADAPNLSPVPGLSTTIARSGSASGSPAGTGSPSASPPPVSSGGFWHRVVGTLEFWR